MNLRLNVSALNTDEGFPKGLLAASYVATFAVLLWMGLSSYTINQTLNHSIVRNFKISGLIDQMTYIGTHSVQTVKLMLTVTDNSRLEESHTQDENTLKEVFRDMEKVISSRTEMEEVRDAKAASLHLIALEDKAIGLIHAHKHDAAQDIIVSKEYAEYREHYSKTCRSLSTETDRALENELSEFAGNLRYSFYLILGTIFVLPFIWFLSYKSIRRWQQHLEDTQKALSHSEERYDLVLRGMSVGVWDWNIITGDLYWSPRFREMAGEDPAEFEGKFNEFRNRIHPEDKEYVAAALNDHLEQKLPYDVEFRFRKSDGRYLWIRACGQATWDENARPLRIVGSVDDISVRKTSEEQRTELVEQLTESNTELERFAYVASHDMQEPLRMVINFSRLLADEYGNRLDAEGTEYLDLITGSAMRMQEMVYDLLEYARIDKDIGHVEIFDANIELDHVLTNLASTIKERKAQISHQDMPKIKGNPVQLMRLLQNLIGNGLKYQKKDIIPKITIGAADKGIFWEFYVKDNGIGMEEKDMKVIFEPFKRLHTWDEFRGTGIGLSLCKKIVENHKGRIWVNSKLGKGSTFYFTWPKD